MPWSIRSIDRLTGNRAKSAKTLHYKGNAEVSNSLTSIATVTSRD